jgi:hypothetical protein
MAELEINNVKDLETKLTEVLGNNSNKPTDEEVEAAKKEYEDRAAAVLEKFWEVGEQKDSQVILDYIEHYNNNRILWTQTGWMGVIKMNEVIIETQNTLKLEPNTQLAFGYQPLEFLFYAFKNSGGIGLQAAKDFEEENEIYAKVFDAIGYTLAEARKEFKEIQFLQDKYAAMAQGFYLELEDGVEGDEEDDNPPQGLHEELEVEPQQDSSKGE